MNHVYGVICILTIMLHCNLTVSSTIHLIIFGFAHNAPGACYDALNNLIWTCSSDYMDQWSNPGNQAFHHVCKRLGFSHVIREPKGKTEKIESSVLQHTMACSM